VDIVAPVAQLAVAVRRPGTWTGQVREIASTAVTAGLWPLGIVGAPVRDSRSGGPQSGGQVGDPVLLMHGYGANRSNWWFLSRHLRAAGFTRVHAVNDHPWRADLPRLAAQCARRIEELREVHGCERVHVVGHSLGGVVARYAIQVLGAPGVATCVTIGSPHGGAPLARLGGPLGGGGVLAVGHQLRPDSPEMELMRSCAHASATRFVAFYTNLDMVVPARRAMIVEPELDATNLLIKDHGHFSVMLSRRLASSVVQQLRLSQQLHGGQVSTDQTAGVDAGGRAHVPGEPQHGS